MVYRTNLDMKKEAKTKKQRHQIRMHMRNLYIHGQELPTMWHKPFAVCVEGDKLCLRDNDVMARHYFHSPQNSNVVIEILSPSPLQPPYKTITLRLDPQPKRTAE